MLTKFFALILCLMMVLPAAAPAEENLFETLSGMEWSFSSGAGGWSTELRIRPDGSFTGEYHDSEMGETGEGYPDGTVYVCPFSGRMSAGERKDDYCTEIRIEKLEKAPAAESVEDGVRYVPAEPYGLSEGDVMLLYSPGTSVSVLSEEMQLWAHVIDQETPPTELEDWFLMSERNDSGFVGFPAAGTGMANPWEDLSADELKAASGLAFGVPEGAVNVIFRYLRGEGLAEMQFTLDGDEYCARILPAAEPTDISGMYFDWENEEEIRIGSCAGTIARAKTENEGQAELCLWYDADEKRQYSLAVYTTDTDGLDLTAVAEQVCGR